MINEILKSQLIKTEIKNYFGDKEIELVERPASYIIKEKNENKNKVFRLIILIPKGFTANNVDEMFSHPEARRAKIEIKGGIGPGKKGFNLLKDSLKYISYKNRNVDLIDNYPYVKVDAKNPLYQEEIKSSREKFWVVKEDGKGFYHNLINLTNEWLLLILEKELDFQKPINLKDKISKLAIDEQKLVNNFFNLLKDKGDKIFEENLSITSEITKIDIKKILPIFIEMLNIPETGKHEQCSVYAIILKFGKKNKQITKDYLNEALKNNFAQLYYLNELIKKLK